MNAIRALKRLVRTNLPPTWLKKLDEFRAERNAVAALQNWTEWDEKALKFYSQFITKDSVCFDVGANLGNRSKIFLKLGARVIAIEPQAFCQRILRHLLGSGRLTIIPKALAKEPGLIKMHMSDSTIISSASNDWMHHVSETGRFASGSWTRTELIQATTLDQVIEEHGLPAFTKIDVEGYESQVLSGLTTPLPAVSFEFLPECLTEVAACIHQLASLGPISANYCMGEDLAFRLTDWLPPTEFLNTLSSTPFSPTDFGDIYIKCA